MKKAELRIHPQRDEWISSITPIRDRHPARFGPIDFLMLTALVLATLSMARALLAH